MYVTSETVLYLIEVSLSELHINGTSSPIYCIPMVWRMYVSTSVTLILSAW